MKKITVKWFETLNNRFNGDGSIHHSFTSKSMKVITSNHPRFIEGTRFDFGFLEIASTEGYTIEILPL